MKKPDPEKADSEARSDGLTTAGRGQLESFCKKLDFLKGLRPEQSFK
jgi:hypothetical protein